MTTRIIRAPFAVDNNAIVRLTVARYKELRTWRANAKAEQDQLTEKLASEMAEHDAAELTVGGLPIARRTHVETEDISVKALRAAHPKIAERLKREGLIIDVVYDRIDVP